MSSLPITSQHTLDLLYRTYALVGQCLDKHNIPYFMIGGTLLGAMRHGGVIPWDDDGDLAVDIRHFPKLRQVVVEELASLGIGCSFGRMGNLKLFSIEGRPLMSEGNIGRPRYPIVDIFPFARVADKWTFFSPACRERWSTQYFELDELDELELFPFGPLRLPAPKAPACKTYLRRTYGDDWYRKAVVAYSHISSQPIAPIEIEIVDWRPGLPSADFMAKQSRRSTSTFSCVSLRCVLAADGSVIIDRLNTASSTPMSAQEVGSGQWRQLVLAARSGVANVDSFEFPLKVRCEDVRAARLPAVSSEAALRDYVQLVQGFLRAGQAATEWFNINRIPLYPVDPGFVRSLLGMGSDEEKIAIGMTAEICSLFKDALEFYRSAGGEWTQLAAVLEWRLLRRLNLPAPQLSSCDLTGTVREMFQRERSIIESDDGLKTMEDQFAGTEVAIHTWSHLDNGLPASQEALAKMACVGCDESQMRLASELRQQGLDDAADYWLHEAASAGNPNAIHLWSRRPGATEDSSASARMSRAALAGDVTARIILARQVGGGDLALYQ
jgi:lipopolysaccharide cholinephosphotransferase